MLEIPMVNFFYICSNQFWFYADYQCSDSVVYEEEDTSD